MQLVPSNRNGSVDVVSVRDVDLDVEVLDAGLTAANEELDFQQSAAVFAFEGHEPDHFHKLRHPSLSVVRFATSTGAEPGRSVQSAAGLTRARAA